MKMGLKDKVQVQRLKNDLLGQINLTAQEFDELKSKIHVVSFSGGRTSAYLVFLLELYRSFR